MKDGNAIEIHDLTKQYRISKDGKKRDINVLNQLNLEVKKGQVLGIIGANGAGKSTLLKILSRITYPTSGEVLLRGTLSSLLEVGTGFHPELSGRENIFLNGSILGMKRSEIKKRFDEIVDFSDVEEFIDTPVKHYSSGMFVRLAFSVAANLTPDILLIDEVLAVGDAAFQQKCLQRTSEASEKEGRTVLFVSHNMAAVRSLCDEVIWLKDAKIQSRGLPEEVTGSYLREFEKISRKTPLSERTDRLGTGEAKLTELEWKTATGNLVSGKPAKLRIGYRAKGSKPLADMNLRLDIHKESGEFLTTLSNEMAAQPFGQLPPEGELICDFEQLPLLAGNYFITASLQLSSLRVDVVVRALSFKVLPGDRDHTGVRNTNIRPGIRLDQKWQVG